MMKIKTILNLLKQRRFKTYCKSKIKDIKTHKRLHKILPVLSAYLQEGYYRFKNDELAFVGEKATHNKGYYSFLIKSRENQRNKDNYIDCKIVAWGDNWSKKVVVIFSDIVISIYNNKLYKQWFNNIQTYLTQCNYPKCSYILFDYERRFNIANRVRGGACSKETAYEIANFILKCNSKMQCVINRPCEALDKCNAFGLFDILFHCQHGDLALRNILIDRNEWQVIDFDTVDFYPLLQDFFRLLCDLDDGFKCFFEGVYDNALLELFTANDIVMSDNEKDKYLACFLVLHPWKRKILFDVKLPNTYKLTKRILYL